MNYNQNDINQPSGAPQPGGQLTPPVQPSTHQAGHEAEHQSPYQVASSKAGETIEDIASTLRDLFNRVPETVNKAVERALNVRDTTVVVRLSEASSDAIDQLVSAGIYKSRSEAATFLIDEGIKAQAALFGRIQEKMTEIERLRAELRNTIAP